MRVGSPTKSDRAAPEMKVPFDPRKGNRRRGYSSMVEPVSPAQQDLCHREGEGKKRRGVRRGIEPVTAPVGLLGFLSTLKPHTPPVLPWKSREGTLPRMGLLLLCLSPPCFLSSFIQRCTQEPFC